MSLVDGTPHPWLEDSAAPLGKAPHLGVVVTPLVADVRCSEEGIEVQMNIKVSLEDVRRGLCITLGVPHDAVMLMHDGNELDNEKTLSENGITLPGPMARRNGAKLTLRYGLKQSSLDREESRKKAEEQAAQQAAQQELNKQERLRRREEQLEAERRKMEQEAADRAAGKPEEELTNFMWQNFGLQQHQMEQRQREDPEYELPPNVLEPCGEDVRLVIERLMNGGSGKGYQVLAVARNVNPLLKTRYERAKAQLLEVSSAIKRNRTATVQTIDANPRNFTAIGDFAAAVNEYPMWHGTPSLEGVKGIFKTGFDIAYAGQQGSVWSPGFYFADRVQTSDRYVRSGNYVNGKYPNVRCILLCRTVCGNLREVSSPPSEEDKMRLTADCLGPGGTFGVKSSFHSVLGGGWAYVCMHRDQVYPEFVALYHSGHQ